jgi:hypothetical protein
MHATRVARLCLGVVAALSLTAGVASAAPINAKKGQTFDVTFDNGQTHTIATNGSGSLTPGNIIAGETGELIPVAVEVTGTLNGEVVFHEVAVKQGNMNGVSGDLMHCAFGFSETDPATGDVFTVSGSADVFLAPRH